MMDQLPEYKCDFIRFLIDHDVLKFGEFTTKSGRQTPYFLNLGEICDGYGIGLLGEFYARSIELNMSNLYDNLFGPAYKGIPLVVATATAINRLYSKAVTFTYNRKEIKDHGEMGRLVGHRYRSGDRIVIVEDVITAGTSIHESVPLIRAAADVDIRAVIVAVDRQERGRGDRSALTEIGETFGIRAFGIVTIDEITDYLSAHPVDGRIVVDNDLKNRIRDYRNRYGV